MSERGVYAIDRGIWGHDAFADEPFTEREAWMWLISEAAWGARKKRTDGKVVELQRGQLCHAIRFMAEAWDWSKSRVERFLVRLEKQDMIDREHGTRTAIITICNYDKFQKVALPNRDKIGTTIGTTAGQDRDKLENIKSIKEEDCTDARASRTKRDYSEEFETKFWVPYPRSQTMSKKEAWREWMKLDLSSREAACKAIEPYKKYLRTKPNLETVHACRFLSQRRFDGFTDAPTTAPAIDIRSSLV